MSESICRFIPAKDYTDDLKTVHFVYETEHESLPQPFLRQIYYLFLVTDGSATLNMAGYEHKVQVGDLFFGYPACPYTLTSEGNFRYLYISFFGSCVQQIFERLGIRIAEPVYRGFDKVSEFWFSAISRFNAKNADFLSESVLLYTLSFIGGEDGNADLKQNNNTMFEMILEYVDNHYRESSLTLGSVAAIFSYTENYLSALFKKQMQLGFNQYVNRQRISYALRLIEDGKTSIREIAAESGFSDALYFSKVFKKKVGVPPSERIKQR
ncbi:MAG: helix-turn-helix transcriptional regulator [Clostridia bacterium]|nr:helix-turn-helix transcriptional regulator [Clostridia bacterium]